MRGIAVRLVVASMAAAAVLTLPVTAAQAVSSVSSVSFDATLNGRPTASLSTNDPLVLRRGSPLRIAVTVHNDSDRSITVAAARLQGRVMGLSFFSFDTQLNLVVAANSTRSTRFDVGLTGLADQADGLLPSSVSLLNKNSDEIASTDITVDVKGKLTSIYGVFGLAIAAITLLWLVSLIYRVVKRTLPENRWKRAVQFSAAGFGVGLALTFSVSALRLLTPGPAVWAPFVFGAGAVGFALGYLTPGPRGLETDDDEDFIAARERQYARIGGGSDEQFLSERTSRQGLDAAPTGPALPSAAGEHQPVPLPHVRPPAGADEPTGPVEHDTTVQASRSDLDSMFGSGYAPDEQGRQ